MAEARPGMDRAAPMQEQVDAIPRWLEFEYDTMEAR
jgi:hypothetical protein